MLFPAILIDNVFKCFNYFNESQRSYELLLETDLLSPKIPILLYLVKNNFKFIFYCIFIVKLSSSVKYFNDDASYFVPFFPYS